MAGDPIEERLNWTERVEIAGVISDRQLLTARTRSVGLVGSQASEGSQLRKPQHFAVWP
jgi:hypothetical protein